MLVIKVLIYTASLFEVAEVVGHSDSFEVYISKYHCVFYCISVWIHAANAKQKTTSRYIAISPQFSDSVLDISELHTNSWSVFLIKLVSEKSKLLGK